MNNYFESHFSISSLNDVYTNQQQIVIYSPNFPFCDPSKFGMRRVDGKSDSGHFRIIIVESAVIP